MSGQDTAYDAAIAYAAVQGAQDGLAAASWYFDGNISAATYAAVLRGLEDGDPVVLDTLPYADLSGEWADSLTGPALILDALDAAGHPRTTVHGATYGYCRETENWGPDICDAYETAYSDAVEAEVSRVARYQTGGAE